MSSPSQYNLEANRLHDGLSASIAAIYLFVVLIAVSAFLGCSSNHASEGVYNSETTRGAVNTALPNEVQEQQQAVGRLLIGLQEGADDTATLQLVAPGIEFTEEFSKFYEGAKRLVRWDYAQGATEGEIPVVLYFDDKESGPVQSSSLRKVERTYLVTGNRFEASIGRK